MVQSVNGLQVIARARVADPVSRVRAAREMTCSGAAGTQAGWFLEAVTRWPGRTASELAESSGGQFDRVQANRRLADLDKKQLIRKTESRVSAVTGRLECTWSPRLPTDFGAEQGGLW
ncbi:MAG: winged helix-turn-helix domain-containing protein [Dehalococcoidia bacterium]|nr:winged helix-turn-helix domain-containing protein [Dehalococcoidia bacterium]